MFLLLLSVANSARPKSELSRLILAWLAETGFGGGVTDGFGALLFAAFVVVAAVVRLVVVVFVVGLGVVVVVVDVSAFSFSR